jgi:hypothetical protein
MKILTSKKIDISDNMWYLLPFYVNHLVSSQYIFEGNLLLYLKFL